MIKNTLDNYILSTRCKIDSNKINSFTKTDILINNNISEDHCSIDNNLQKQKNLNYLN